MVRRLWVGWPVMQQCVSEVDSCVDAEGITLLSWKWKRKLCSRDEFVEGTALVAWKVTSTSTTTIQLLPLTLLLFRKGPLNVECGQPDGLLFFLINFVTWCKRFTWNTMQHRELGFIYWTYITPLFFSLFALFIVSLLVCNSVATEAKCQNHVSQVAVYSTYTWSCVDMIWVRYLIFSFRHCNQTGL